jgi:hypothetical protein
VCHGVEEQDAQGRGSSSIGVSAREYRECDDGAPAWARCRRIGVGFGLVASAMVRTWRTALDVGGWEASSIVLTDPY